MARHFLYTIILLFVVNTLFSKSYIITDWNKDSVRHMRNFFEYELHQSANISFLKLLRSDSLKPLPGNTSNFGVVNRVLWLKLDVVNISSQEQLYFLKLAYPTLNEVYLYEFENDSLINVIKTGDYFNYSSRVIESRNYVFLLNFPKKISKTYYLGLRNDGENLRLPLTIERIGEKYYFADKTDISNAFHYGFFLFALLFNILLAITLKERSYANLALYILTLGLFILNTDGISFQKFWPNMPWWANHSTIVFISLANLFILLLTVKFLHTKEKYKSLHVGFVLLSVISSLLALGGLLNGPVYFATITLIHVFSAINSIYVTFVSLLAVIRKQKEALLYFLSFVLLMLSVLFHVARNLGYLPVEATSSFSLKTGFVLQVITLSLAVSYRFKSLMKKVNYELENLVKVRTAEIEAQRDYLYVQKEQISKKNSEIGESIRYAEKIQSAALPTKKYLDKLMGEYFVLFKPRDIVSGDFYWVAEREGKLIVAAADCTGHGVPGGFLSMLGISCLNEIIANEKVLHASEVLNKLRKSIQATFCCGNEAATRDGMDIALCIIDRTNYELQFSGAYNPLIIVRNGNLLEFRADKMPIGVHVGRNLPFTNHIFDILPNDSIYLFSDGYADQFGGKKGKKYKKGPFKKLLESVAHLPMANQKNLLEETLFEWQDGREQIDDILVLGIRV